MEWAETRKENENHNKLFTWVIKIGMEIDYNPIDVFILQLFNQKL